jgi:hypothetical protein
VENGGDSAPHIGVEVNASHSDIYLTVYYIGLCLNVGTVHNNCDYVIKRFHAVYK